MEKITNKFPVFIIGFLLCFNILAWLAVWHLSGQGLLEIIFFDVGQGDAIFIESPGGHQILIDGGPSSSIVEKLGQEIPFWDRTIDLIILTHPDYDHLRGLIDVLQRYEVENILWTGIVKQTKIFEKWLQAIEREGAEIFIAQRGQRLKAGRVQLYILHPLESRQGELITGAANDTSIVAKLLFGENSFLFPGDITNKAEGKLIGLNSLSDSFRLASQFLKVAHHGSKTSSSEEFLQAVGPQVAVVSCGRDNPYGHPHADVLARLQKFAIRVLRTDQQGNIKISSDGKTIISNF